MEQNEEKEKFRRKTLLRFLRQRKIAFFPAYALDTAYSRNGKNLLKSSNIWE